MDPRTTAEAPGTPMKASASRPPVRDSANPSVAPAASRRARRSAGAMGPGESHGLDDVVDAGDDGEGGGEVDHPEADPHHALAGGLAQQGDPGHEHEGDAHDLQHHLG